MVKRKQKGSPPSNRGSKRKSTEAKRKAKRQKAEQEDTKLQIAQLNSDTRITLATMEADEKAKEREAADKAKKLEAKQKATDKAADNATELQIAQLNSDNRITLATMEAEQLKAEKLKAEEREAAAKAKNEATSATLWIFGTVTVLYILLVYWPATAKMPTEISWYWWYGIDINEVNTANLIGKHAMYCLAVNVIVLILYWIPRVTIQATPFAMLAALYEAQRDTMDHILIVTNTCQNHLKWPWLLQWLRQLLNNTNFLRAQSLNDTNFLRAQTYLNERVLQPIAWYAWWIWERPDTSSKEVVKALLDNCGGMLGTLSYSIVYKFVTFVTILACLYSISTCK